MVHCHWAWLLQPILQELLHSSDDCLKLLPQARQLLHVLLRLGVELYHLSPATGTPVLIVRLHRGVDTRLESQQL